MAGEESQEIGREGVRRAKEWLERTGRVDVHWTVYEFPAMLTVKRPAGGERSFDLGGVIKGGDLDKRQFFAEIKRLRSVGDQPSLYGDYLATCYCKTAEDPDKLYEFMWITWHPFGQTRWPKLVETSEVVEAVTARTAEWLGDGVPVDEGICALVAERLWLIVLSDRQHEHLGISDEMLGEVDRAARMGTRR